MKFPVQVMQRVIAGCLVLLLSAPFGEAAPLQQEQSAPAQQPTAPATQAKGPAPSEAGAGQHEIVASEMPDAPMPAGQSQAPSQQQQSPPADSATQQQSNAPAVGTAAAPLEKPTGVAVSRPAGAAIAPAKQRRVRTFLISIGVVIGAGVAIGTVAALSHASPSRP